MTSLGLAATPEEDARIVTYLAKNFPQPAKKGADPPGKATPNSRNRVGAFSPSSCSLPFQAVFVMKPTERASR